MGDTFLSLLLYHYSEESSAHAKDCQGFSLSFSEFSFPSRTRIAAPRRPPNTHSRRPS